MTDVPSIELLSRFRRGDDQAARAIFDRYTLRLMGLTRQRLSARLARRMDPEDVVQSVFRSFFRAAEQGEYELQQSGDLWRLLAAITLNKVRMHARTNRAGIRDVQREESVSTRAGREESGVEGLDREPCPEDAAILAEQVELLMRDLDDRQRRMLEMRLQGHLLEEIADDIGCSERTIRRWLEHIKASLEQELDRFQMRT